MQFTDSTHEFVPIAMESSGVLGPQSLIFVKELGRKLRYETGKEKVATYLIQHVSIAVQQGNAISTLGGLGSQHVLELLLCLPCFKICFACIVFSTCFVLL